MSDRRYYQQGREAFAAGKLKADCPYACSYLQADKRREWLLGWIDAEREARQVDLFFARKKDFGSEL